MFGGLKGLILLYGAFFPGLSPATDVELLKEAFGSFGKIVDGSYRFCSCLIFPLVFSSHC